MKYIKSYENINNQITINIIDFVNFIGNMYDAVEYFIGLKNISKSSIGMIEISEKGDIKRRFNDILHDKVESEFYNKPGDDEGITLFSNNGHARYSYGYLNSIKNMTITFYNIPKIKTYQDILTIVDAYKFNL